MVIKFFLVKFIHKKRRAKKIKKYSTYNPLISKGNILLKEVKYKRVKNKIAIKSVAR